MRNIFLPCPRPCLDAGSGRQLGAAGGGWQQPLLSGTSRGPSKDAPSAHLLLVTYLAGTQESSGDGDGRGL